MVNKKVIAITINEDFPSDKTKKHIADIIDGKYSTDEYDVIYIPANYLPLARRPGVQYDAEIEEMMPKI